MANKIKIKNIKCEMIRINPGAGDEYPRNLYGDPPPGYTEINILESCYTCKFFGRIKYAEGCTKYPDYVNFSDYDENPIMAYLVVCDEWEKNEKE